MAWFDDTYTFNKPSLRIAHVTDCHLFADRNAEYFGVNTATYFQQALEHMALQQLDAVVFGGDLTQDHSVESYLLFSELVNNSTLACPVFWLPGNHDEIALLEQFFALLRQSFIRIEPWGYELLRGKHSRVYFRLAVRNRFIAIDSCLRSSLLLFRGSTTICLMN